MSNTSLNIGNKVWVVFSLLAIFGFAIIGKVFKIQLFEKEKWKNKAAAIDKKEMEIPSTRGEILSSDGTILAVTVPTYTIHWDSKCTGLDLEEFESKMDTIAECFAKEFKGTKLDFIAKFKKAIREENEYASIVSGVDFNTKLRVDSFPIISRGQFKSGFIFEKKMTRTQLFENLAGRTIGKTYKDNLQGRHGLEKTYNKELAGSAGKQLKTKIPGGAWKPVSDEYIIDPIEGVDLISSIDVHLQDLTQFALLKKLKESQAEWGCAILMEVETGYIRAIANLKKGDSTYYEGINLAVQRAVDPGSTFKIPIMMAVLEDKLMSVNDTIDTKKGFIQFYDKPITDTHANGRVAVGEMIEVSSNVGMAIMVDKCYKNNKQGLLDRLNGFGLGDSLNIEIHGATPPSLYKTINKGLWSGISHVQLAMGYEMLQTPLQTLAFYNAIANDGKMMRPLFAEGLAKHREIIKEFKPVVLDNKIASNNTIEAVQSLLIDVCHSDKGTAYNKFKNSPYLVAGKTGTVRVFENNKYLKHEHRGSFVGYFPANNPKYTCIVVIHKPSIGAYYGSELGAPVFKEIADQIFNSQIDQSDIITTQEQNVKRTTPVSLNGNYKDLKNIYQQLGIEIQQDEESKYARISTKDKGVKISSMKISEENMPDLKDMSLQDAIIILEKMKLRVVIKGVGRIKKQSIKKGTSIKGYKKIILELA